jgi:tetratricopeptide (TPR) repeat protein
MAALATGFNAHWIEQPEGARGRDMQSKMPMSFTGWSSRVVESRAGWTVSDFLLRVVDVGLCAILCVAPFFFGGRHDLGRLLYVLLIGVTSAAWFVRQARFSVARSPRTVAYLVPVVAGGLVIVQLIPLPPGLLAHVAPRTYDLLPLWSPESTMPAHLGIWRTISFTPHETAKSLAMLVSYGLLFAVVVGRIRDIADINRLLAFLAVGAGVMAIFGILQYFTSDGRFFWFYAYPARTTTESITGAFINRNHFAGFLVLGLGPLAAHVVRLWYSASQGLCRSAISQARFEQAVRWSVTASLAVVILAILGSRSRGGAMVMLVAGAVLVSIYVWRRLVDVRFVYGLVGLGAIVITLLSFYGYDDVAERLDDFAEGSLDEIDHGAIRRKLWAANLTAFRAGWLAGAGAGSHREICPVYLPESLTKEYVYAENGYLQIATETGLVGLMLLAAAIWLCVTWCMHCIRHARREPHVRALGAAAAGLAASAVHSLVDFVWYVPACMAGTIVLAACVLRLSQIVRPPGTRPAASFVLPRSRWLEIAAASVLLAAWSVHAFVGPAMAAVHWDRYLRAAMADYQQSNEFLSEFIAGNSIAAAGAHRANADPMLRELLEVVSWDPAHARAHRRLANRYMAEFERRGLESANRMDITQLSDAAMSSEFESTKSLTDWLHRAFGPDIKLLECALRHARRTVELCPLQGEGYVYLADLCFLNQAPRAAIAAFVDQGLRVRPYDRNVLHRAGRQELLSGRNDTAIEFWSRCFNTPGPHQQQIVFRLVYSGMPARMLIQKLLPQWHTLREVWDQYGKSGTPQDLSDLLSYAAEIAPQVVAKEKPTIQPAAVWYRLGVMYADVGRVGESLACLQRAYACDSTQYAVRYALGKSLLAVGRLPEAEPHVRWCLARRPGDKNLTDALLAISKHRLAIRTSVSPTGTSIPALPPLQQRPPAPVPGSSTTIQQ